MIILIGVSGAGKSTLRDYALQKDLSIKKLIAITDRPPRATEQDRIDKLFVDQDEFLRLESRGELCLINKVYEYMYAFRKKDFKNADIYLGEIYYKNLVDFIQFHPNTVSIYINTQSKDALKGLYVRGSSREEISIRKRTLLLEEDELNKMCNQGKFDYVFYNDFTEQSKMDFYKLIESIIRERQSRK